MASKLDVKNELEAMMTEEIKKETEGQEETQPEATPKQVETEIGPIPYERFKEVNERMKGYAARLAELEAEAKKRETEVENARVARLKEQEKFQELADEFRGKYEEVQPQLEATKASLLEHEAILEKHAASLIEDVPELYREIVEALPLLKRLEWLTENKDKLTKKEAATGVPATPKGVNRPDLREDERRRLAARTF